MLLKTCHGFNVIFLEEKYIYIFSFTRVQILSQFCKICQLISYIL